MKCDECGGGPSTVRYTEIVDGQLRTWNLCEQCSRSRGVGPGLSSIAGPLVNILMSLLEDAGLDEAGPENGTTSCPRCGLTYEEFRRTGRLGCDDCYEAFREELRPLLRRIHGCTEHVGGFPPGRSEPVESLRELRRLRTELERAVAREDYERAADLRDEIRTMVESGPGNDDVDA